MPVSSPPRHFYTLLAVPSTASFAEISAAYRTLSLRSPPPPDIHEAYLVLSDPERKAVYDQYGLEGLREGVPAHEGYKGYKGGWAYHGRDQEVFKEFHGGTNLFAGNHFLNHK
jgi:DnaJ family protein B protein 13